MKISRYMHLLIALVILAAPSIAAEPVILSGTVTDAVSGKPVVFGTVIVMEARIKAGTGTDGNFSISLPGPGEYTIVVRSGQLQPLTVKLAINKSTVRNFQLQPVRVRGEGVTITGRRDVQKVSRYTMTQKELKEVPGSFGDSVSALASMPGVIRSYGLFGPLVVRGASSSLNLYLIDDIPVYNPLHFGGIHSVINNNLIRDIDLYASAAPARYGSTAAAVIDISTVDDVRDFSGYTDIGLISASALFQAPILRDAGGKLHFARPAEYVPDNSPYSNAGYIIASGRIGYLSVFIPLAYQVFTGDRPDTVPEYWDYQMKMKYYFNSRHSLTFLSMGSSDYIKSTDNSVDVDEDEGGDPLLQGASMKLKADWSSHSQGLYYTWQPAERLSNRVIAYAALIQYYSYFDIRGTGIADWLKDIKVDSRPYIYGLKDRLVMEPVKDHVVLTACGEYTLYRFTATGKTLVNTQSTYGDIDPGDEDLFATCPVDEHIYNQTAGGYIHGRFALGDFTVMPGVRADYLDRTGTTVVDPRGSASYEFPTETTLSIAGGQYSYFIQTNPSMFNLWPNVAGEGSYMKPERAIHRVAGIEQKIEMMSVKIEGFYNTYSDMLDGYYHYGPDGDARLGMSTGRMRTHGFEIMLKKELNEDENGFYGWVSYTYTRARYKSGLPTYAGIYGDARNQLADPYGDTWIDSYNEQRHAGKLVAAYTFRDGPSAGRHTISVKFLYNTSLPYDPITGSVEDTDYAAANPGKHRYVPTYGKPASAHFDNEHQLDIRYSYRTDYSWGYVSWYIELINVYGPWNHAKTEERWDYREGYSSTNPTMKSSTGLSLMPNFGVEIKF